MLLCLWTNKNFFVKYNIYFPISIYIWFPQIIYFVFNLITFSCLVIKIGHKKIWQWSCMSEWSHCSQLTTLKFPGHSAIAAMMPNNAQCFLICSQLFREHKTIVVGAILLAELKLFSQYFWYKGGAGDFRQKRSFSRGYFCKILLFCDN